MKTPVCSSAHWKEVGKETEVNGQKGIQVEVNRGGWMVGWVDG